MLYIKPLQLILNTTARLVFNLPNFSHVTPLLCTLHWLQVKAHIQYKTMVLAYRAPPYLQVMIKPCTPTRALRSGTAGLLAFLLLREGSFRLGPFFSVLAPQ